ncbi:hypothetical protein [Salinimicrobium sp. WS361]|uniref:hypothetical protein n=1 Tax=Salinimicrobium sp. WS361 TaxID=3425123 RepID=UPI003D6F49E0
MTTLEKPYTHKPGIENSFYKKKEKVRSRKEKISFYTFPQIIEPSKGENEKVTWFRPTFSFTILGEKYLIDRNLYHIYESIDKSKTLLELNDDWDDEGAVGSNELIYKRSIHFLVDYAKYIYEIHNSVIEEPEINLVKDGSIDLEWRNENYILLINIRNTPERNIHYYGEDFKKKTIIKGFIDYHEINKDLGFWMQKL